MSSQSTFFDSTSPFVAYTTQATRGVIINLLRIVAMNYKATPNETFRIYFDGLGLEEKTVGFKQLLNVYINTCCEEYLTIHRQIVEQKLQKSELNKNNLDHYVYLTMENIMSQTDGYKHLNCVFDGLMTYGILQFRHIFTSISNDIFSMSGSSSSRGGNFSAAELNIIRAVLQEHLNETNKKINNDDISKNYRLKCDENDSCKLKVEDEKQRLEEIGKTIQQEMQS